MKNKEFFTIKNNGTDASLKLKDFNANVEPLPLEVGQFLHVGYYKPFRQFYIAFEEANDVAVNLSIEYYNGTSWVELPNVVDESQDLIKSGFIYFERPADWKASTVDNDENFYIRMSVDVSLNAATSLKGVSVLLSNDDDLIGIRSNIVSKLNNGKSWLEKHEAARKYIIQHLRNMGHRKVNYNDQSNSALYFNNEEKDSTYYSNLTAFDLLEPFELREAAKYKAASMIYLDELSDEEDDKYFRMGTRHSKTSDEMLNVFMLKIDVNDDGKEDLHESEGSTRVVLSWE